MKKHRLFFSLIELLIVVAVIGILTSLLLPALKSARDKAHALTCLSNMKQVGFGSAQYTGDNDDWLVPNWNGKDPAEYDGDRYERHWYGLLCGLYKDPPNLVIAWNTPGPYGLTWGITGVAQPKRKGQFSCPAEPELQKNDSVSASQRQSILCFCRWTRRHDPGIAGDVRFRQRHPQPDAESRIQIKKQMDTDQ